MLLDEGFSVDVMSDGSTAGEHWRLFVPRENDPHFIFTDKGIETESRTNQDYCCENRVGVEKLVCGSAG